MRVTGGDRVAAHTDHPQKMVSRDEIWCGIGIVQRLVKRKWSEPSIRYLHRALSFTNAPVAQARRRVLPLLLPH